MKRRRDGGEGVKGMGGSRGDEGRGGGGGEEEEARRD